MASFTNKGSNQVRFRLNQTQYGKFEGHEDSPIKILDTFWANAEMPIFDLSVKKKERKLKISISHTTTKTKTLTLFFYFTKEFYFILNFIIDWFNFFFDQFILVIWKQDLKYKSNKKNKKTNCQHRNHRRIYANKLKNGLQQQPRHFSFFFFIILFVHCFSFKKKRRVFSINFFEKKKTKTLEYFWWHHYRWNK